MAITEGQKNLIRSAIDFLLDFPEDQEELAEQISLIREALTKEVPEEHEFYALRKFLFKPTETLHGIEKFNNETTIAEVQTTILDLCLEAIKTAAKDNDLLYESFKNWLKQLECVLIPAHHHQENFSITQPNQTLVNFPWENMRVKNEIFTCSLYLNEEHNGINIVTEVNLPNSTTYKITTLFVRPLPEYLASNVINAYLYELIPAARSWSYEYAKKKIVEYLYKEDYIDDEEYIETSNNSVNSRILCHEYYLDLLCDGEIDVTFLNILTEHGVNVFCHESVVELLENECLTIDQALPIQPHHLQLITTYYKALRDKTIDIRQIVAATESNAILMQLPFVINFIPFEIAAKLPSYFINLFKNTILTEYFSNHPIDLTSLAALTEAQCTFLNNKEISILIANEALSLKNVLQIEPELHVTLKRSKINRLVANGYLLAFDIQDMSINAIKLLEEHPYLSEWFAAGIISLEGIQPKNLVQLYTTVYAERLFALQHQDPYMLFGAEDNILSVCREIKAAAHHAEVSQVDLQEKIIKKFIETIKAELTDFIGRDIPKEEIRAFKKILKACEAHKASWNEVLIHCIEKANSILEDLKGHYSYFSSSPDFDIGGGLKLFKPRNYFRDRPLYKFCSGMLMLAEIAAWPPQQPKLEDHIKMILSR